MIRHTKDYFASRYKDALLKNKELIIRNEGINANIKMIGCFDIGAKTLHKYEIEIDFISYKKVLTAFDSACFKEIDEIAETICILFNNSNIREKVFKNIFSYVK